MGSHNVLAITQSLPAYRTLTCMSAGHSLCAISDQPGLDRLNDSEYGGWSAHSIACTFVESATSSVFRIVETTQSWLNGDSTETVPSGHTGESSIGRKTLGNSENVMRSHSRRRRGPEAEGRVNLFKT